MLEPEKLQKLGEEISEEYLNRGVPLTSGLDKVASRFELNKNQIHRVAEVANVKTHLHMLKEASAGDAYIEFDIANPSNVKSPEIQKEAAWLGDYESSPSKSYMYSDEPIFKTASTTTEERKNPAQEFKDAIQIKEKLASLQNKILEGSIKLENRLVPIYNMVKQAVLNGSDVDSISYIIKEAAPLGPYVAQELNDVLKRDRIELKEDGFDKFASKEINTDSQLFKKVAQFHDEAVEILKTAEELIKEKKALGDHPILKTAKKEPVQWGTKTAGLLKFIKKYPKTFMATGAYSVGRTQGVMGNKKTTPILKSNYNQNRPERTL